ncbi:MAG: WG repeat-containing protein [Bacteroidetes bacterium]|nr:WG repeat-containing protein [Bacteroidota bacterium]
MILASSAFGQDNGGLYPIPKADLWGYIDTAGATVIAPRFHAAGRFSEGLAPVRLNGTYGYIDRTGAFVIAPKYDLALSFEYGQAQVFIDGKSYFIDRHGNITFQHTFESISSFGAHSYTIAMTRSHRYGLINRSGQLIADTVFGQIKPFDDGLAVVEGLIHFPFRTDSTDVAKYAVGVLDTTGRQIVPYGRYKSIRGYQSGFAIAELLDSAKQQIGRGRVRAIIDTQGKQRFVIPSVLYDLDYQYEGYSDGVAIVTNQLDDRVWRKGVMNSYGEIVLIDSSWRGLSRFSYSRAFAKDAGGKVRMIDKSGKQVGEYVFDDVVYETQHSRALCNPFVNGTAFVKLRGGWCSVDTTGKVLTEPRLFDTRRGAVPMMRVGNKLIFMKDVSETTPQRPFRYGFINATSNDFVEPVYDDIDIDNIEDDLISVAKDGVRCYITKAGSVIWNEEKDTTGIALNVHYMNRGYCYASSKVKNELAGLDGWGGTEDQRLQVVIDPSKKTTWSDRYVGMTLLVANASKDTLYFPAQDSRLKLKMQAQDKNGEWKDIEYLPNSWCGNSYHTLSLEPNKQWKFSTPVYHGEFKTKLRAQLTYKRTIEQEIGDVIYSNEIDGFVNPGQFWYKREYHPRGLMDPYYE